ncbi:uncharacterized protein N7515_002536 [Penicillium bovifimosum]|uniref:Uncharacterized protein n=1 Tax=Penicillium bovifimosum TaxID=126998 RepID=A0A9W9HC54_9EURO|nr:uncharacterized protein N7515_002536 [Penicillium bovifimosum]KAJ5143749.1 hypothetical protein N7515_002536 [Penicillium bovifimosum]
MSLFHARQIFKEDLSGPSDIAGRAKAIVLGDTKFHWSPLDVINSARPSRADPDFDAALDIILPIEQVQHYCAMSRCRFGFLFSEAGAFIMAILRGARHAAIAEASAEYPTALLWHDLGPRY